MNSPQSSVFLTIFAQQIQKYVHKDTWPSYDCKLWFTFAPSEESAAHKELRKIITAQLNEEIAKLRLSLDEQIKQNDESLQQKLVSVEGLSPGKTGKGSAKTKKRWCHMPSTQYQSLSNLHPVNRRWNLWLNHRIWKGGKPLICRRVDPFRR